MALQTVLRGYFRIEAGESCVAESISENAETLFGDIAFLKAVCCGRFVLPLAGSLCVLCRLV